MTAFETIREQVDMADLARHYGISLNRHGKALCPLHGEKTASFSIKGTRWRCFGCGAGGDAVALVSLLEGITALQAARKLDGMYGLGLFEGSPQERAKEAQAHQQAKERIRAFTAWERRACTIIADYLRLLDSWKLMYAPQNPDSDFHPLFVEACRYMDYWDWIYHQVFILGDFETKVSFWKTHAKEVAALEHVGEGKIA